MSTIFLPRFFSLLSGRRCALLGFALISALSVHGALPNLTVNYNYGSGVVIETADQTIATSGTVQVASGAQITFNAGVKVTLSPGFSAQGGSYFHAAITGAPLDSDGDGIPDYWEIQYGLNPNNAADAALDPNGNGLTNLQEYAAGNNPLPSSLAYELHYDTNQRDQLTAIKKADGTPLAVYTYLVDQRRASRWLGNNTQTDYGYDGAGRMTLLDNYCVPNSAEIQKQEYGYDLRDRREWTQRDGNLGDTYAYQADSELTDFKLNAANPRTTPSGWTQEVSYAYDAVGNRSGVTNNGVATNYTVDHANQYTAVTGATVQYNDGRGNVTQWNAWTYIYDADNRMLSATKTGMSITFAYDPAGRLVKRVTNGQTEYFCYDGMQQVVRTDQNATVLSSTIWGPNADEVLIDSTPQNGNRYFHSDIQGTTLAVTDDSRVVLERYRYDAYGNTTFYDANWNQRSATAYNIRFLYTGQERMSAADGLYNYKNRFYSPELGRFLQTDPKGLSAGDNNLYRYCGNDPFDRADPTGLESDYQDPARAAARANAKLQEMKTKAPNNSLVDVLNAGMARGYANQMAGRQESGQKTTTGGTKADEKQDGAVNPRGRANEDNRLKSPQPKVPQPEPPPHPLRGQFPGNPGGLPLIPEGGIGPVTPPKDWLPIGNQRPPTWNGDGYPWPTWQGNVQPLTPQQKSQLGATITFGVGGALIFTLVFVGG